MNTPICDFVRKYAESKALRLHMPGHKGVGPLGVEALDITEISGADSLYEASGIILESEQNASSLFGCETLYSTEGSSLCIRAMLYLAMLNGRQVGRNPLVLAGRNAHKTFLSAAALLDLDVEWIYAEKGASYLSCRIDPAQLDDMLSENQPCAVYLTSPDYLGNVQDIAAISRICRKHGAMLLVDNAHGAYLKFLPESRHPIDLGADLCCDSAHKTLGVLTGGAYLHISPQAPEICFHQAKNALALFGSTSPSYLILQSLDAANKALAEGCRDRLAEFAEKAEVLKQKLASHGYTLCGNEALKITISAKPFGYTGKELSRILFENNIVDEFADPDFVVMMLAPGNGKESLDVLEKVLLSVPRREAIADLPPAFQPAEKRMSVREACFSPCETVSAKESEGRILAAASVGCPPAVPIVVCGERIDRHAVECFRYYGVERCTVVK